MTKLFVATSVRQRASKIIEDYREATGSEGKRDLLRQAFEVATFTIGQNPLQGRFSDAVKLGDSYRFRRLRPPLPVYVFSYYYDAAIDVAIIYHLQHERQKPLTSTQHRKLAAEARREFEGGGTT